MKWKNEPVPTKSKLRRQAMKITTIAVMFLVAILLVSGFACCPEGAGPEATPTPTPMTLDDAGMAVHAYLLEQATTSEGMEIVAAWNENASLIADPYQGDSFFPYEDGWLIAFTIYGRNASTYAFLISVLEPPSGTEIADYFMEFFVEADGTVMPLTADAIRLVAAIRGD